MRGSQDGHVRHRIHRVRIDGRTVLHHGPASIDGQVIRADIRIRAVAREVSDGPCHRHGARVERRRHGGGC